MTEVAVRDDDGSGRAPESALLLWARDAAQAERIAKILAQTSFVPASLRGKPHDLTAALLAGQELGLQPMATLRSMDVIQGTPALRAHAMRGLVQSRGYEVEVVESSDTKCVMRGRRGPASAWQFAEWDLERAKKLGLTSKDQWVKQPRTMLIARATGEICRLIAADVLYAMPYASEELDNDEPVKASARVTGADLLDDIPAIRPNQTAVTTNDPRPFAGAVLTVKAMPPSVDDDPAADTLLAPAVRADRPLTGEEMAAAVQEAATAEPLEPQGISGPQMRKLQALFRDAGIDDRQSRLAWASDIAGRELASSNDLTRVEAGRVIDAIEVFIAERVAAAAEVNAEAAQPDLLS